MRMSCFKPVSFAVSATNAVGSSKVISVWPIELLPTMEGELTDESIELKTKGVDGDGKVYTDSINIGATVKATWIGGGNKISVPNVRRGERLMLYSAGDSQTFYWDTLGMDQGIRRLETVIYAFNGNPINGGPTDPSPRDSYYLEVSTHKKLITLETSRLNGEMAKFVIQIDTGKGKITIKDEKGNFIFLDSVNGRIYMENADKSHIDLDKKLISIFAEEFINAKTKILNIEAGEEVNITTKATTLKSSDTIDFMTDVFKLVANTSIDIETASTTLNSATDINIKTGMLMADCGGSATIKAGVITLDGMVMGTGPGTFAGPVAAAALAAGGGAGAMSGGGALEAKTASMAGPIECGGLKSAGPVDGMPTLSGGSPVMKA